MPHYFDEAPGGPDDPRTLALPVAGRELQLRTSSGVFSRERVDPGTAVLLGAVPDPPPHGTFLDLGCGYGPIALAMAALAPAAEVWAVDVNERARELCAANAGAAGLGNVRVAAPEDVPAEVRFDLVWSNPPIRIGKQALHELLLTWLARLDGVAYLVVQRHLGADSLQRWLGEQGRPAERIASKKAYRVLRCAG